MGRLLASSDSSSSISVASVPFDVTGDGPTRSLGLARWFAGDMRAIEEPGRSESIELADELEMMDVLVVGRWSRTRELGGRRRGGEGETSSGDESNKAIVKDERCQGLEIQVLT